MSTRTVEISSPARLSLRHRQLVVAREDGAEPTVPIEDLALLVVDNPQVVYTHTLLAALAEAKVAVVMCGADHLPAGVLLPYAAHALAGERLRQQLACPRPLAKRLWQAICGVQIAAAGGSFGADRRTPWRASADGESGSLRRSGKFGGTGGAALLAASVRPGFSA